MEQYILKSTLVAEIDKVIDEPAPSHDQQCPWEDGYYCGLNKAESIIENLKVKSVDLEKAIDDYIYTHDGRKRLTLELDWKYCNLTLKGGDEIIKFAKHFFELGLRSTITEEDCKLIWTIGDDIPYMAEEEFYKELLKRYKAQKGE